MGAAPGKPLQGQALTHQSASPIMSSRNHGEYEAHQDMPPVPPRPPPPPPAGEAVAEESSGPGFQMPQISFSPRIVGIVHCAMCLIAHSCFISASKKNGNYTDSIANSSAAYGNLIAAGYVPHRRLVLGLGL